MKAKLFLVATLLTFLNGFSASDERIYGGYRIDVSEAPYVVSIVILIEQLTNGTTIVHQCTGSILRTNLILTAAHCNVDEADRSQYVAERFFVNVGTNRNDLTGGTVHSVKTVFVHPKFKNGDANYVYHDVGLLELHKDITLSGTAQLVQLAYPNDRPKTGQDCTITGYGTNPDVPHNRYLYQVHLNVITAEQCVKEFEDGTVKDVDKNEICVQAPGKNQCQGDSGGPMHDVSTNRQVGIVSHGARDCSSVSPSVLTRVTDNLDFIERVIRKTTRTQSDPIDPQTGPQTTPQTTPQKNPTKPVSSPGSSIINLMKPLWSLLRT